MQIMIGSAKEMRAECNYAPKENTSPLFKDEALANAMQMSAYSEDELAGILKCNAAIAGENKLRFMRFTEHDNELQAILSYNGVVYKHLGTSDFTKEDFKFAGGHLWITSFLYGLLRPLDMIKCYRLEGDVVLPDNGCSMFDYWKARLTDVFIESVKNDDGVLLDLASSEMHRLFNWSKVKREITVVRPEFYVCKGGKLKTVVVYAKMCRGEMTRFAIKNRLDDADALRGFTYEGFRFIPQESTQTSPVFVLE